jgi:hypothetical protein
MNYIGLLSGTGMMCEQRELNCLMVVARVSDCIALKPRSHS